MKQKLLLLMVMSCWLFNSALAQQITIKGKITSSDGAPIPGASIKVQNVQKFAVSDSDGNYNIDIPSGSNTLEFSFIGFASQTKTIGTSRTINVVLEADSKTLNDVIITGVAGATQKEKMTVSVTKITAEQLTAVPPTSLSSALSGKVAGLKASSFGGLPGQSTDILLRGDNNLNNVSSNPLIVVDGVIMSGSLADLNADDVESIEVVKGAAASALYGSRAGNGVISVTTKRGKGLGINSTAITIRNEYGLQNLAKNLEVADAHPYALATDWETYKGQFTKYAGVTYPAGYKDAGFNTQIAGNRTIDADHYLDNPYGVMRNQQDDFFITGKNYTNFISLSNRSEKNNLYASFENNSQQGVVALTNGYKRQNFRFNYDQNVTSWLKIGASNLFINKNVQEPGGGGGLFYNIARQERDVNLIGPNPDGQPYYLRSNQFNQESTNPLYPLYKTKNNEKTNRWLGNFYANVKFANWINLDLSHSIEIENYRYETINPKDFWTRSGGTAATNFMAYSKGSMRQSTNQRNNQNTQFTFNLNKTFGDLNVKGKLSYLYENNKYESNSVSANTFVISGIENLENVTSIADANSYKSTERAQNYFAIVGLDYKDKFLLDGMYRYDGSSLFGADARWNPYYRISGAYRISQDVKIKGIDELKVRAAIGTAGIRPDFAWQYEVYSLSNGVAKADQKGNSLLKPSKTKEMEVGLNIDFLKRFNFEATYAKSETKNQFLNAPLIAFLNDGFNKQWLNAGVVQSNTLEITLGAKWIRKQDLMWHTNFTFSRVRQKITELPIAPYLYSDASMGDQSLFYVKEGEAYGAMYGYKHVRTLDEMAKQLPNFKTIADYEVNSDGYVVPKGSIGKATELPTRLKENGADWYGKIGDGNADFNMGIANTFKFKDFTFYFLLDWKQGGDIYNGKDQRLAFNLVSKRMDMTNVPATEKKAYDYWSSGMYDKNDPNAYWVEDGTYLKVREVAIGYSLGKDKLQKLLGFNALKSINFRVVGRNLFTFTNYSGYDPEVGSLRMPYDGIYMNPNFRNYSASLTLDF
jgi:TonB-linked SusC/RagA family outer membrane protein